MNLDDDLDNPASEVELDSLGSFFIHLIDNDYYQDDAEASHVGDAEVIILSSGSEPLPTQKTRQASRKVRFSHPLAHLDPHFLLKKQQQEARCTIRHSGQVVTSAGLPNTPVRKRRPEVSQLPLIPRQVISDNLLIRLIQIIRELPIPPLPSQQERKFQPSKQFLGEHI